MNLETKITIYKFTPQLFTLTRAKPLINGIDCFFTAAPCIDYIKGYDPIRKKPVKLYV